MVPPLLEIRPTVTLLCWALLLSLCVSDAAAQETLPRFEWTACPFAHADSLDDIDCGYLFVPENRARPGGRVLRLAVAMLRSHSATPRPDPLVFLAGGPGEASVKQVPRRVYSRFWNALRRDRDIIFFDQRGAGYSEPRFCPELSQALYSGSFQGLAPDALRTMQVAAVQRCRQHMLAQGLDFAAYNSATSARDLDDLRRTLGYAQWNLFGISYGTRLALTAMRDTPEGIRSVVLDSSAPPNIQFWVDNPARFSRSLRLVFQQCANDTACHHAFPTLERDFYAVLERLEQQPVVLTMSDTERFPQGRLVIDGTLLAAGIFQGLYERRFIPLLPLLIQELKSGNAEVLKAIADGLVREPYALDMGLLYAINCYEVSPFNPPAQVAAAQARHPELRAWYEFVDEQAICAAWHHQRAGPLEQAPVVSDIPALILAGEFDPITAPAYGRLAAATLSQSTFIEARGFGHGVAPFSPCARDLMLAFLAAPSLPLDTRCIDELEPVRFVTEAHLIPQLYPLIVNLRDGHPWLLLGLGVLVITLLSAVPGWPVAALVQRVRGVPRTVVPTRERLTRWLIGLAALISLIFLAGLAAAIKHTAATNPFMLAFGLPGPFAPLLALPGLAAALGLGALPGLRHWWRRATSLAAPAHAVLVTLACLGCVTFAGYWGLWRLP